MYTLVLVRKTLTQNETVFMKFVFFSTYQNSSVQLIFYKLTKL